MHTYAHTHTLTLTHIYIYIYTQRETKAIVTGPIVGDAGGEWQPASISIIITGAQDTVGGREDEPMLGRDIEHQGRSSGEGKLSQVIHPNLRKYGSTGHAEGLPSGSPECHRKTEPSMPTQQPISVTMPPTHKQHMQPITSCTMVHPHPHPHPHQQSQIHISRQTGKHHHTCTCSIIILTTFTTSTYTHIHALFLNLDRHSHNQKAHRRHGLVR